MFENQGLFSLNSYKIITAVIINSIFLRCGKKILIALVLTNFFFRSAKAERKRQFYRLTLITFFFCQFKTIP